MSKTYGVCACGCGETIVHEGSSYAGADAAERGRHRARLQYKRKTGETPTAGTREAMATLGLADDVTLSDLAATVAAASAELSRRVAGVDAAEVQRQIDAGLAEARAKVEIAEGAASKAEASLSAAADQLKAAIQRAEQADQDAIAAGNELDILQDDFRDRLAQMTRDAESHARTHRELMEARTKVERSEAAYDELKAGFDRAVSEARRSFEAEAAVKLADQRTEHERELSRLREEIVRLNSKLDQPKTAGRPQRKPTVTAETSEAVGLAVERVAKPAAKVTGPKVAGK